MTTPEASNHPHGTDNDPVIELMRLGGVPVTRESYIHVAYMGNPPEPWTAEHEAELPPELRREA